MPVLTGIDFIHVLSTIGMRSTAGQSQRQLWWQSSAPHPPRSLSAPGTLDDYDFTLAAVAHQINVLNTANNRNRTLCKRG